MQPPTPTKRPAILHAVDNFEIDRHMSRESLKITLNILVGNAMDESKGTNSGGSEEGSEDELPSTQAERQRFIEDYIRNPGQISNKTAAYVYAEFIVQCYVDAKEQAGDDFSIDALKQPPRNSAQQKKYNELLDFFVEIIEYLVENNVVLDPGSPAFKDIKPEPFSIENHNAHIYWLLEYLKCGHTGEGIERVAWYVDKYGASALLTIVSVIDFENIPEGIQREVARRIQEGLLQFLPPELPTTHTEALLAEMYGLPISTIHFFWAVVKSINDCPIIGGAMEIQSFLRRLLLNLYESGMQEFMRRRDPSSINPVYIMHEFINGNFLGFYIWSLMDAKEDVDDTYAALLFPEQTVLRNNSIHVEFKSTWPPGVLNRRYRAATECILDNQVGEENHSNSTEVTPLDCLEQSESILAEAVEFGCPKCTAESETGKKSSLDHKEKCPRKPTARLCYAAYLYTEKQLLDMMASKDTSLEDVAASEFGGIAIFDEDKVATSVLNDGKGMKLEDYILESEPILPNGETGEWRFFRRYLKVVLLKLDYDGDDYLRLAIVIVRTCSMIDTDPNKKWDWETVAEMGIDARSQQWLQEFCILASSSDTNLITDKSLDCKLGNLLFAWTITVGSSPNSHVSPKALSLKFKNYLEPGKNLFNKDENGLRKDGDFAVAGKSIHREIGRKRNLDGEQLEDAEATKVTLNRKALRTVTCCLTRGDADSFRDAANLIREGVDPKALSWRHTTFKRDYVRGGTRSSFEYAFDEKRNNRGHVGANFAATNDQIDENDLTMALMIWNGGWYFVQGKAVKVAGSKKAAGVNFNPPARGTLITSERRPRGTYELDGVLMKIRYLTSPQSTYIPNMVYESIRGRCKPLTKKEKMKKMTKKKVAIKFPDYEVETPLIPPEPYPSKNNKHCKMINVQHDIIPHHNVVPIRFKWKGEGTEEDRLRELREHLEANDVVIKEGGEEEEGEDSDDDMSEGNSD